MKTVAAAISDTGLIRDGNEDQYLIDESLGLYVVCDGMGGHAAGEVAAERAIEFASDYLAERRAVIESASKSPDGFYRVLKIAEEAVQSASQELYQLATSTSQYAGMGTTMTMLVVIEDKAIMAHVGDSRLYLMRQSEVHQLSSDHTLANELFLLGELTKEQASTSRYQHVLTRSIGPHEFVHVDTLLFDLIPGDRVLLCSDGLSNYFADNGQVAAIMSQPEIIQHPETLVEFARQSGGADNITAIVLDMCGETTEHPGSDVDQKIHRLRNMFLCEKVSVRRLMHVISAMDTIHCGMGQELLSLGDDLHGMYLVLEGGFRVIDEDVVEGELIPGDYLGEAALLTAATAQVSLVATAPSRLLFLDRVAFGKLTRRLPKLGNLLLRNLGRHLARQVVALQQSRSINLDDTSPLK